jgi:hypothetical protein
MSIIDDRGRIFGRFNLVDAAVGVLLLVLLPAAYGAYRLFKEPVPTLTGVYPNVLRQGPNLQVEVRGTNFRPYMRVSFSDVQGRTFLFNNPTSAVVQLADMPPGKYDIVLYDYMQEVARMRGGFTLETQPAPPMITVDVDGFLTSLSGDQVKRLAPGHRFPEVGDAAAEILTVGAAEPEVMHIRTGDKSTVTVPLEGPLQLPVRMRTKCFVETTTDGALKCTVAGVALGPDANVRYPGLESQMNLRVTDVHYPGRSRTATVRVRFVVSPDVLARVKNADQDLGARAHPAGEMATLISFTERGEGNASMLRDERVRQAVPTGRLVIVEAVLAVPVQESALGWMYKDALVKAGAPFSFETALYTMDGGVIDVAVKEPAPPSKPATPPSH